MSDLLCFNWLFLGWKRSNTRQQEGSPPTHPSRPSPRARHPPSLPASTTCPLTDPSYRRARGWELLPPPTHPITQKTSGGSARKCQSRNEEPTYSEETKLKSSEHYVVNIWSANCVFSCLSQSKLAQFNFFVICCVTIDHHILSEMIITTRPDLIINQYVVSSALIGHIRPSSHLLWILGAHSKDQRWLVAEETAEQKQASITKKSPNIHSCALFPKNYLRIPTFLPLFLQLESCSSQVLSLTINQFCLKTNKRWILFVLLAIIALFLAALLWYPMLYSRYLAVCHRHLVKRHISINLKYKTESLPYSSMFYYRVIQRDWKL